jgi:hypothetical protein
VRGRPFFGSFLRRQPGLDIGAGLRRRRRERGAGADRLAAERVAALVAASARLPAPSSLRERLLASAAATPRLARFTAEVARLLDVPPPRALEYLAMVDVHELWQETPYEGVTRLPVAGGPKTAGAVTHIVRVVPGKTIPMHVHFGPEIGLILQGRGRGEDGHVCKPGDCDRLEKGTSHSIEGLPVVDCVMIVVAFGGISFGEVQILPDDPRA